ILDLGQDALVEPRRRKCRAEPTKITLKILLNGLAERHLLPVAIALAQTGGGHAATKLAENNLLRDLILRIKGGQAANEILKLAHIAWPGILHHRVEPASRDAFRLEPFPLG